MSVTSPIVSERDRPGVDAPRSVFAWPTWRQAWFQLHWLLGITAGTVLVVVALSGATLAFRDELLDAINPGVRHVRPSAAAVLTPDQLVQAVRSARPTERVAQIAMSADAGTAARVNLAPPFGVRRGETLYLDPYTGAVQPPLRGAGFFEWVESLHRWLLLPRDDGRVVTGVLSICLLGMALSGLYLRWPKRALDWRTWLTFDSRLAGRPFLWSLHSVLGTWALAVYLLSTSTGIYWAFDSVRQSIDGWLAIASPSPAVAGRPATKRGGGPTRGGGERGADRTVDRDAAPVAVDLAPAWAAFGQRAGAWTSASLRVPQRASQPIDIAWLAADAPHERARSRMLVLPTGEITQDERYAAGTLAARLQSTIYPLHMGSYFGLPGRIATTAAALMLPMFAVTGWMLYLKRRRAGREARIERAALIHTAPPGTTLPDAAPRGRTPPGTDAPTWLVAYASQTGHAERLAWRTAAALIGSGAHARVESVATIDPATLARQGRVLLVASSFGDGGPPDAAQRFMRRLTSIAADGQPLRDLRFGLLALGDRRYANFCGFGHALADALQTRGARSLFPPVEVDDGDADIAALARWSAALATMSGATLADVPPADASGEFVAWTLSRRELLNPGSQGGPLYALTLTSDRAVDWRPGALVDIVPRHPPHVVRDWLRASGLDGAAAVRHGAAPLPLSALLARCELPVPARSTSAQALADGLTPLMARRYSVASIVEDGAVELLVRQERHASGPAPEAPGLGVASGWLTAHAAIGDGVELRLVANPSFAPCTDDLPCIFIGNGSGLAGLRSHLRARVRAGRRANWLVFGEREQAHDRPCHDEIAGWQASGFLERADLVFSRDPPRRVYVQDRLRESADLLRAWAARGACIFVCGSLHGMSAGVDAALREALGTDGLDDLIAAGRYRRDVY